jgi:hypothetical protein
VQQAVGPAPPSLRALPHAHDPAVLCRSLRSPAAEVWVKGKATEVLGSKASVVAGTIRREATCLGLSPSRRANADACAES